MEPRRARGRPKAYDSELALAAALGEFRARGYSATSLDHLSAATKMARPSLYAAFGNKLEIYRKAVRQYAEASDARRSQALFDMPSFHAGLEAYFSTIIDLYISNGGEPLGCPILSVISGEAAADPQIGAVLSAAVEKIDALFLRRVQTAAAAGEIPADADLGGIAKMLAALQHALALRARAGERAPGLLAFARSYVALVLKAAGYADHETALHRG